LTAPQQADSSLQGHATVNLAVIHIFLDHPIVGVGPGQSDMYTQAYSNAMGEALRRINVNMSAQNTYLQQMADQGIIGFGVFMTILWIALRQIWRARRAHLEDNPYAAVTLTCLLLAVLSYLTQGLFVDLAWERYFWLILAVSAVAARLAFEEPTDPSGLPVSISNSLSR
jgi:putative inorganic carbon (HCO3(-)) transporter